VLELHGPQPMADPTVDVGKRARCLREPEVSLPTREVGSERLIPTALKIDLCPLACGD
jgi:hypothetical protein